MPETRREAPAPDAPAHRRLGRRLAHARVLGEAEVVVRAQQQHGRAVERHARALRPAHQARAPLEPGVAQDGELVLDREAHGTARLER